MAKIKALIAGEKILLLKGNGETALQQAESQYKQVIFLTEAGDVFVFLVPFSTMYTSSLKNFPSAANLQSKTLKEIQDGLLKENIPSKEITRVFNTTRRILARFTQRIYNVVISMHSNSSLAVPAVCILPTL